MTLGWPGKGLPCSLELRDTSPFGHLAAGIVLEPSPAEDTAVPLGVPFQCVTMASTWAVLCTNLHAVAAYGAREA